MLFPSRPEGDAVSGRLAHQRPAGELQGGSGSLDHRSRWVGLERSGIKPLVFTGLVLTGSAWTDQSFHSADVFLSFQTKTNTFLPPGGPGPWRWWSPRPVEVHVQGTAGRWPPAGGAAGQPDRRHLDGSAPAAQYAAAGAGPRVHWSVEVAFGGGGGNLCVTSA